MPRNSMQSTNEFIGCASLDLDVTFLSNFLNRSVTNTQAQAVLVTIDGRLVASAPYNLQTTLPPTSRSWNTTIENFLDTTSFQKLTSQTMNNKIAIPAIPIDMIFNVSLWTSDSTDSPAPATTAVCMSAAEKIIQNSGRYLGSYSSGGTGMGYATNSLPFRMSTSVLRSIC